MISTIRYLQIKLTKNSEKNRKFSMLKGLRNNSLKKAELLSFVNNNSM